MNPRPDLRVPPVVPVALALVLGAAGVAGGIFRIQSGLLAIVPFSALLFLTAGLGGLAVRFTRRGFQDPLAVFTFFALLALAVEIGAEGLAGPEAVWTLLLGLVAGAGGALLGIRRGAGLGVWMIGVDLARRLSPPSGAWPGGEWVAQAALLLVIAEGAAWFSEGEARRRAFAEDRLENLEEAAREADEGRPAGLLAAGDPRSLSREERRKRLLREVYDAYERVASILHFVHRTLRPYSCVLYLRRGDHLHLSERVSLSDAITDGSQVRVGEGLIGRVAKTGEPIALLVEPNRSIEGIPYYRGKEGIRSFLAVPLVQGQEVTGVLCADSQEEQAFQEEHRQLLEIVARQILEVLEHEEMRRQWIMEGQEVAALYQLSRQLTSEIKLDRLAAVATETARAIIQYDWAAIAVPTEGPLWTLLDIAGPDPARGAHPYRGRTFDPTRGLLGWVVYTHGRAYRAGSYRNRERRLPIFSPELDIPEAESVLCLPLRVQDRTAGALVLMSRRPEFFTDHEVQVFDVFANQLAAGLQNARLLRDAEDLAITDGLTGLKNHRYFQEALALELKRAERHHAPLALIMADIDFFKRVNDTYGHRTGDGVLRRIADILARSIREVDHACRYGGEEFALVLVHTPFQGAERTAERIRKAVAGSIFTTVEEGEGKGREIRVTVSAGIAAFPEHGSTPSLLIERADQALYKAKRSGRNRVVVWEESLGAAPVQAAGA